MIIRNLKSLIALWAALLAASMATPAYAEDPYGGTSKNYQPGEFQRSGVDNPILKNLLSPETFNRRKANYAKWESLTPQQQEELRQERLNHLDFQQPKAVMPIDDGHPRARTPKSPRPVKPASPNQDTDMSNSGIGINQEDAQNEQIPASHESYYPPPANAEPSTTFINR